MNLGRWEVKRLGRLPGEPVIGRGRTTIGYRYPRSGEEASRTFRNLILRFPGGALIVSRRHWEP